MYAIQSRSQQLRLTGCKVSHLLWLWWVFLVLRCNWLGEHCCETTLQISSWQYSPA